VVCPLFFFYPSTIKAQGLFTPINSVHDITLFFSGLVHCRINYTYTVRSSTTFKCGLSPIFLKRKRIEVRWVSLSLYPPYKYGPFDSIQLLVAYILIHATLASVNSIPCLLRFFLALRLSQTTSMHQTPLSNN